MIPVQKKCNMDCCFCSTKLHQYHHEHEMMVIDSSFYENLAYMQNREICYFELTGGGEPFLNVRLQDIIHTIRERIPDAYIKVYTNGRIHSVIEEIDELNISVIHWERRTVRDLCGYDDKISLEDHLAFFRGNGTYKIRLSVPMISGAISNQKAASELIERTRRYVDLYAFRPLNPKTKGYAQLWADFDLNDKNVEIDRDFCDCEEVVLWFSDNKVYRDWDLKERLF